MTEDDQKLQWLRDDIAALGERITHEADRTRDEVIAALAKHEVHDDQRFDQINRKLHILEERYARTFIGVIALAVFTAASHPAVLDVITKL